MIRAPIYVCYHLISTRTISFVSGPRYTFPGSASFIIAFVNECDTSHFPIFREALSPTINNSFAVHHKFLGAPPVARRGATYRVQHNDPCWPGAKRYTIAGKWDARPYQSICLDSLHRKEHTPIYCSIKNILKQYPKCPPPNLLLSIGILFLRSRISFGFTFFFYCCSFFTQSDVYSV